MNTIIKRNKAQEEGLKVDISIKVTEVKHIQQRRVDKVIIIMICMTQRINRITIMCLSTIDMATTKKKSTKSSQVRISSTR